MNLSLTPFAVLGMAAALAANITYFAMEYRVTGKVRIYRSPFEGFRVVKQYSEDAKQGRHSPLLLRVFWTSVIIMSLSFVGVAATLNQQ